MKLTKLVLMFAALALLTGCASKGFVEEQILASEARSTAQLTGKTSSMEAEIAQLKDLQTQLSEKTDMALNQAKGFESYQILWQGEVNFDFDSDDVTSIAEQTLMEAGQKMEQHPEALVELVGHTDQTGSDKYNLQLGEKRAESVKRYLADHFGISLYRMFTLSYGKQKPLERLSDETNSNHKNRRVKVLVWGKLVPTTTS